MRRGVVVAISLSILLSTLSLPDGRNVERWKGEQWHPYEPAHRCSILMDNDSAAHFIYHQNDRHIEHWFEWWYLNIKGDDGNNLLVEFFTFRNLSNPLTSLVGVVVLFMPADGSTFESVKTYPFIRSSDRSVLSRPRKSAATSIIRSISSRVNLSLIHI